MSHYISLIVCQITTQDMEYVISSKFVVRVLGDAFFFSPQMIMAVVEGATGITLFIQTSGLCLSHAVYNFSYIRIK